VKPFKAHDALTEDGTIEIETPTPSSIDITMTGAVAAHCWVGCHSIGVQRFQLVQEFEMASPDPEATSAELTLESSLKGYLRGRHKGTGCLQRADAAVYAAGRPTPLRVAFAPACVAGPGARKYEKEVELPAAELPLGRYVLVMTFTIQADADGITNGHGVADFSDDPLPSEWQQVKDPFKDVDRKDFGFSVTLTASSAEDDDEDAAKERPAASEPTSVRRASGVSSSGKLPKQRNDTASPAESQAQRR
jgi:hypothetical protein